MGTKFIKIPLQTTYRRRFQIITNRSTHTELESRNLDHCSDLEALFEQKLNVNLQAQSSNGASIHRVPDRLRSVEPEAYEPNIVSIGPYHHGSARLQAMETTKWRIFHGLFNPSKPNRPSLNAVLDELKEMEPQARGCYSEDFRICSNQFVKMMLVDSCFIVEILREKTKETGFTLPRWMLPVLQRDLIMLENQLPLFILNKVYNLTQSSTCEPKENTSLKDLAVQYFEPMIYKDLNTPKISTSSVEQDDEKHFLDLFRASICPTEVHKTKFLVKEPHMFRSITELKESGVKIKKAENCQPLDVSFKKGVLKIAPVSMDDYRFTLLRNMVAFEQCQYGCKPYVTAYVFFLDRLINSSEDIESLHYSGVLQHSLGGNKHAARLVNKLCKDVADGADDSYLQDVIWKINCYCNDGWNQKRAKLKHEYFYNVWVSLSTIAAILIIYLTIVQTISGLNDGNDRAHMSGTGFWVSFAKVFTIPFKKKTSVPAKDELWIFKRPLDYEVVDDMNPKTSVPAKDELWIFKRLLGYEVVDDMNPKTSVPAKDELWTFKRLLGYEVVDDMNPKTSVPAKDELWIFKRLLGYEVVDDMNPKTSVPAKDELCIFKRLLGYEVVDDMNPKTSVPAKDELCIFKRLLGYEVVDDMNPFFFMSC